MNLFDRFVDEVVRPSMCSNRPQGQVVYQAKPSLRVQPPGSIGIRKHRDAEYHHQAGEINWWLPITDCYDSNTLQLESAPDLGDFKPLNLKVGQVARFWGNQCLHETLLNETSITRVSFDFRVVRDDDFDNDALIGRRPDGSQRFHLGGYYRATGPVLQDTTPTGPAFKLSLSLPFNPLSCEGGIESQVLPAQSAAADKRFVESKYNGWILVHALTFLVPSINTNWSQLKAIASSSLSLYRAVAAELGCGSLHAKQWREWRASRIDEIASRATLSKTTMSSDLDTLLGEAAKSGVPPSFASDADR